MAITYSISGGADAGKFNIDPITGALTFKAAPNFEAPGDANADNVYEVDVCATDAGGLYSTKPVKVTVTDVSEGSPPQITSAGAISVLENQTTVMTVTATDPDDVTQPPIEPPGGEALPPLTASGSITVTANNQVIENKLVTGKILCEGRSGVTIRNVHVKHPAGIGIEVLNSPNLTIEDVKIENTNYPAGQKANPAEVKNLQLQQGGPYNIARLTVSNGCGIYAVNCTAKITISHLEGHNMRGSVDRLRGQVLQYNQCSGGLLLEDFCVENDPQNSWSEDNISMHKNTGSIIIRRGFIDGNNAPTGVGIMMEVGTHGALIEDVDVIHMGNGAFSTYSGSNNNTFRRCRVKDTILSNQGRGVPTSNYLSFCSTSDCSGTRFEQVKYFNVKEDNLAWDANVMAVKDWTKADFTPRAPIRNRAPGT